MTLNGGDGDDSIMFHGANAGTLTGGDGDDFILNYANNPT